MPKGERRTGICERSGHEKLHAHEACSSKTVFVTDGAMSDFWEEGVTVRFQLSLAEVVKAPSGIISP